MLKVIEDILKSLGIKPEDIETQVSKKIEITAFGLAERFIGTKEMSGSLDNPQILAMLRLDDKWPENDEVPWCSAFVNYVCWLLRLPRSKSLTARSWLGVGINIPVRDAKIGFDVVILKRGQDPQPGPEVTSGAPGHVGFFAGYDGPNVLLLGGNQGDTVNVSSFPTSKILGVRRLLI